MKAKGAGLAPPGIGARETRARAAPRCTDAVTPSPDFMQRRKGPQRRKEAPKGPALGPPHPPFGHLLPGGEKTAIQVSGW
jgi:hypothetical protein